MPEDLWNRQLRHGLPAGTPRSRTSPAGPHLAAGSLSTLTDGTYCPLKLLGLSLVESARAAEP